MWWCVFKGYRNIKLFLEGYEERIWLCVAWYRQYHCIHYVPKGWKIPKCHANSQWNNQIPITCRGILVNFQKTICTETALVGDGRFGYRTQSTHMQTDPSVQSASSPMSTGVLSQGVKWPWSRVNHPPPLLSRLRIGSYVCIPSCVCMEYYEYTFALTYGNNCFSLIVILNGALSTGKKTS